LKCKSCGVGEYDIYGMPSRIKDDYCILCREMIGRVDESN